MNDLSEILMSRGMMKRHAVKAGELFGIGDGSKFAKALATITSLPTAKSGGAIVGVIGERGVGKTQLAACAMAHWYEFRIGSIRYIRFAELAMRFRDAIKNGREIETLLEFQGEPDQAGRSLLVIDEMDKRAETEHERRTLSTLIDGRYGYGRFTLLIGNDTAEGLMEAVGPTVGSRMNESGGVIVLDGKNYREASGV